VDGLVYDDGQLCFIVVALCRLANPRANWVVSVTISALSWHRLCPLLQHNEKACPVQPVDRTLVYTSASAVPHSVCSGEGRDDEADESETEIITCNEMICWLSMPVACLLCPCQSQLLAEEYLVDGFGHKRKI
jgi:hypothetical protein